jgi:hypothetical protein
MHTLFVTAHHIVSLAHYLALLARTLSRPISFSHWVTFALAPAATWYMVSSESSSVNVSHRFALFRMHLTVCRATGQPSVQRTDTEPRTVRRTTERTGNIHCCCSNCCCAHTVVPTLTTAALLLHHTAHRPSHRPLLHHTAHHSSHQPLLHQPLLHRPLLHRPLLH